MAHLKSSHVEYRGYSFELVHYGAGWRVHIMPGPRLLSTSPDHVLADTVEDALTKARAIVDHHFQGRG
ncbi:hypothetical protein IB267_16070 [Ensifer sp. ENS09]|uniref:hypothetical protein n=1 Tax=Ensifer sp. ENS09 TaxID=2769263 RepID=UPI0017834586|nr:hypothetical protein [Ensifer sp. ENS09]MBD9649875.1 hypothetical protein [Ensifer sp. ENS09]